MRGRGINYDTGFIDRGLYSRASFEPETVRRELQIIRDDLHCNLVRVTGGDPERLEQAAAWAADLGLEVWFSPFTSDLTEDEMLALLQDCATRAERIRKRGAEVVFVTGAELSLLNKGFLPGETIGERVKVLTDRQRARELFAQVPARIDAFLARAVPVVRECFRGKVTYAAIPIERVDWSRFDTLSVDFYRSEDIAAAFADATRALVAQGKPVAITELGAATYRGASKLGARALFCVEWDEQTAKPLRLDADYERDELEQATCIREHLEVFEAAGVDTTILFTFAAYAFPHRQGPRADLDLAAYGIVKVLENQQGTTYPDLQWEPKAAFATVARYYSSIAARR